MSLSDEFKTESVRERVNILDRFVKELPDDMRVEFIDAMHNPSVRGSAIARVMTRHGFSISQQHIQEYRRNMDRYQYDKDGNRVYK